MDTVTGFLRLLIDIFEYLITEHLKRVLIVQNTDKTVTTTRDMLVVPLLNKQPWVIPFQQATSLMISFPTSGYALD